MLSMLPPLVFIAIPPGAGSILSPFDIQRNPLLLELRSQEVTGLGYGPRSLR